MHIHRYALVALSLILVLPACGGKSDESARGGDQEAAEKIVEDAVRRSGGGEVNVDLSGDSVRFTGEDDDLTISTGAGASLPENFPKDIPVYKNAELLSSASSRQDEAFNATWTTGDDISKVLDFVTSGMQKSGWNAETALTTPRQRILAYTKDERGASFMIAASEEKTTITMSTGKE